MAKSKKPRPIKYFFNFVTIFPIIYFFVLMATMTVLSYFYARTGGYVLLTILIIVGAVFLGFYVWYLVYMTSRLNIIFIDGLYNTTMQNFETISRNQNRFFEYPNKGYKENCP